MRFIVDTTNALYSAVGAASAQFANMDPTKGKYLFTTTTGCLIKQGSNPTAAAAAGNTVVNPGDQIVIDPGHGVKIAVIQAAAGGHATLTPIAVMVR